MDIQNLRYFLAVYHYRNITKAAEVMHISQSALSRKIISLEEELGVQLLFRKKYMELTPAGEQFATHAQLIVDQEDHIKSELDLIRSSDKIRIGFNPEMFLPPLYEIAYNVSASDQYRNSVIFHSSPAIQCIKDLQTGAVDLAYTLRGEIDHIPDVIITHVRDNALAVIVPRGHRFWQKAFVSFEDLAGETIILTQHDNPDQNLPSRVVRYLTENAPDINLVSAANSFTERALMVCSGAGIGITGMYADDATQDSSDYYRKILIRDTSITDGDIVLAHYPDNKKAADFAAYICS